MSINRNHPTSLAFKKNEVNTLELIVTRKLLKEFTDLDEKVKYAYYNYKDRTTLAAKDFVLHADFEMPIETKRHKVIIGANVIGDFTIASYFLAVCGKNKSLKLIRKFHFDYAHPRIATKQPVPVFHLQYGGKMTDEMGALGITDKKIDPWLSVPRLNYQPINLALLLDMIFCEFRTVQTKKITEDPDWKSMIKKNEELMICPYHNAISDFSKSAKYGTGELIRDYCYGR
jgi:hypothetical protein